MNIGFQLAIGAIVALVAVHWIFMKILQIAKVKRKCSVMSTLPTS